MRENTLLRYSWSLETSSPSCSTTEEGMAEKYSFSNNWCTKDCSENSILTQRGICEVNDDSALLIYLNKEIPIELPTNYRGDNLKLKDKGQAKGDTNGGREVRNREENSLKWFIFFVFIFIVLALSLTILTIILLWNYIERKKEEKTQDSNTEGFERSESLQTMQAHEPGFTSDEPQTKVPIDDSQARRPYSSPEPNIQTRYSTSQENLNQEIKFNREAGSIELTKN